MTLIDLITALDARGVRLSARLVVDTPAGALTPELREALSAHKSALLARLVGAGVERPIREAGTYAGTIYQEGLGTPGAPCLLRVRRTVPMPAGATGGPATIATCILWPDGALPALSALRWGPARDDPEPGSDIDHPKVTRPSAARQAAADPYAIAEREAIQSEGNPCGLNTHSRDNGGDGGGVAGTTPAPLVRP
jgi:hypothetical protein